MNRAEFMSRLTALLQDVPPAEREEALTYYNEYFEDAGEENEAGVIAALGSPEELAKSIKAGLSDGGNTGEFTESGFHSYEQKNKNQIMSTNEPQTGACGNDGAGGVFHANGAQTGGFQGNPFGQQADSMGGANGFYGQEANAGNNGYGTYGQQNAQSRTQKKPMTGGQIALIIALAVLLSPVWIGILGGLFGGGLGLLAGLFGILIAFLVIGVVMTVVGIALVVGGFATIFSAPLGALCLVGGGLIMVALGLVFVWLMVLFVGRALPALCRGCVNLCSRLFKRGGAQI